MLFFSASSECDRCNITLLTFGREDPGLGSWGFGFDEGLDAIGSALGGWAWADGRSRARAGRRVQGRNCDDGDKAQQQHYECGPRPSSARHVLCAPALDLRGFDFEDVVFEALVREFADTPLGDHLAATANLQAARPEGDRRREHGLEREGDGKERDQT